LVVGYDGARNVRDEERSVGKKKLVRKAEPPPSKRGIAWPRWTGFRGMTLRSWLELLVVPLALVVIGFLFSVQQDARQQRIENQRAEAERELAVQRAQDEALQAYLDQMSGLLLERDLRVSESGSEVRTLARARTLTVLSRFDPSGKTAVMQFLVEANLVQGAGLAPGAGREPIIDLRDADLSGADLTGADLTGAYLFDANLSDANLSGAEGITNEELERKAASLKGATMPNGQKYEAWLKDKESRKQNA
jgi:Pentapeptide repeats (8 copies)